MKKWLITIATGIMIFLVNADATIVNLALPQMAKTFHANLDQLQWVITSYLIAAVIFFTIGGRLADHYGNKRIFCIGATLFFLSCLGGSLAPNLLILDLSRFIQGIGFAFTLSLALIINADAFPKHQQGLSVGISVTITGVAQAIGPSLGGVIIEFFHWRYIFAYAVPLSLLSLLLSLYVVPKDNKIKQAHAWFKGFIDASVLKNKPYLLITFVRILYMSTWAIVLFAYPLYMQETLKLSPLHTATIILCMTGFIGLCSPFTGFIMDRIGYVKPILFSSICCVISFIILSNITSSTPLWQFSISLALFGIGSGVMIPASVRGAMHSLAQKSKSFGMGLFFSGNFLLSALGVATATALLGHSETLIRADAIVHIVLVCLAINIISMVGAIRLKTLKLQN